MKAKTSPTGYLVTIASGNDLVEFPVARFDDDGYAMICNLRGRLVRAVDHPGYQDAFPMGQVSR
jgi:hypothetical protein